MIDRQLLDITEYTGEGYRPLIAYGAWRVAILNTIDELLPENIGKVQRHDHTDEVFVLWRGRALIFVSDGEQLHAEEMQPGAIYNVPQGAWHNLLATRDASWIIVENRDTHLGDTELRTMTPAEWAQLRLALPAWATEGA